MVVHAADGHAPLAGAVADEGVCADDPAHEVVGEPPFKGGADGLVDQVGPDRHLDLVAQLADVG